MNNTEVLLKEDIDGFVRTFPFADNIRDSRICITGATGLIGYIMSRCLAALGNGIEIFIPVRNRSKAGQMFHGMDHIHIIETDNLVNWAKDLDTYYDYVIHCACPTSGKYMTAHPLETYNFTYQSTYNLLDYSRRLNIKGFVYVSSLEYYGQIFDDRIITEDIQGYIDPSSPRSSYPLGKRAAEYLCTAFAIEHGTPAKIARLTQTFGAGVAETDNRVFAQFARSIISGEDIVLHTTGESAKPYCYTTDAVSAILHILLKGDNGEAYNVANDETYISICDMAQFLCREFNPNVSVRIEQHPEMGYAPVTKLNLSTIKLRQLGWQPTKGLKEMFTRLISTLN